MRDEELLERVRNSCPSLMQQLTVVSIAGACNTLPKTSVFFDIPTTSTLGAGPGLRAASEYGSRVG